jgi:hypothetical protein
MDTQVKMQNVIWKVSNINSIGVSDEDETEDDSDDDNQSRDVSANSIVIFITLTLILWCFYLIGCHTFHEDLLN